MNDQQQQNQSPPLSPIYWSVGRFESLYKDVVIPLIRRSEFQRQTFNIAKTVVDDGSDEKQQDHQMWSSSPLPQDSSATAEEHHLNTSTPDIRISGVSGVSGHRTSRGMGEASSTSSESEDRRRRDSQAVLDSFSKSGDVLYDEEYPHDDPHFQSLWKALITQRAYFTHPLGQCYRKGRERTDGTAEVWTCAGRRDYGVDKSQLHEMIELRAPELTRISVAINKIDDQQQQQQQQQQGPAGMDNQEDVNRREAIVGFLVDHLSNRLNLHQLQCLHLLVVHLQLWQPAVPPAVALESCVSITNVSEMVMSMLPVGWMVLESCCTTFRREQLYHLSCIQDLATDIYPLEEPGVEMSNSVSLVSTAFFREIIKLGFFDNLLEAIKFLLFESTRRRAEFPIFALTSVYSKHAVPSEDFATDRLDRGWTRRLAHIAARILLVLIARFHVPLTTLVQIAELLGGSVFDETSVRKLRSEITTNAVSSGGSSDELLIMDETNGALVTTKEFDIATQEDLNYAMRESDKTAITDPLMQEFRPAGDVVEMTGVMAVVLMNAVDPAIVKWSVDVVVEQQADEQIPSLPVEFPTARLGEWLTPPTRTKRDSNASLHAQPAESTWIMRKSDRHDVEPFWEESLVYGRLLSFAVTVAFTRPFETRRFQLALSSGWNLFHAINVELLDRLGGESPLSKVTCHTISSLLQQSLLPINQQWAHIVRTDRLSRQAKKKKSLSNRESLAIFSLLGSDTQTNYLTPIVSLLNRLCGLHPSSIPKFACLFFAIVETFPWHELSLTPPSYTEIDRADQREGYTASRYASISMGDLKGSLDLCESYGMEQEEIPPLSGIGLPVDVPIPGSQYLPPVSIKTMTGTTKGRLDEQQDAFMSRQRAANFDDLAYLFPLFIEVLQLGATITAAGPRSVAVQVSSKLTTQPSLVAFFIPQSAERVMSLFQHLISGTLQTELLSTFSEQRRARSLKLRRGEFGPGFSDGRTFQFVDENDDAEDRRFRQLVDVKFSHVLGACQGLFRFLAACYSPRLFLTIPLPPSLLAQAPPSVRLDSVLGFVHSILKASVRAQGFGVGDIGRLHNSLHLVALKCIVTDGLASGFELGGTGSVHVFIAFIDDILPVITDDLQYLHDLASGQSATRSDGKNLSGPTPSTVTTASLQQQQQRGQTTTDGMVDSQSGLITSTARKLIGHLAISFVTYFTSVITRTGYRYRYSDLSPTVFESEERRTAAGPKSSTNEMDSRQHASSFSTALLTATRFVVQRILRLLDSSCVKPLFPLWHFWRLSAVTLKFLRCILRGPLPLLGHDQIDAVGHEPFLPPNQHPNQHPKSLTATDWLMRASLSLDSLVLSAVLLLTRAAWQEFLCLRDSSENSCNLFQLQSVQTGLDILRLLFQRDTLFLCWWEVQRIQAVRSTSSAGASSSSVVHWDFISGLAPVNEHLMRDGSRVKPQFTTSSVSRLAPIAGLSHDAHQPTDSVPHAVFILELALSERHRSIRKRGLYLLQQLNCREPTRMAAIFRESPHHLGLLRATMASILRDLELEEFEKWEYFDNLGIEENSHLPLPGCPEALLLPLWNEELDNETTPTRNGLSPQDSLGVWQTQECSEVATFKDEIASVDFPSYISAGVSEIEQKHPQPQQQRQYYSDKATARVFSEGRHPLYGGAVTSEDRGASSAPQGYCLPLPSTTSVTSRYTGLPIHQKLEGRINSAEDAACATTDISSWFAFLRFFDPSQQQRKFVSTSLLPDLPVPISSSLLPAIANKAVANNNSKNSQVASQVLSSAVDLLRSGGEGSTLSSLSHFSPFDGLSSRTLCLLILQQALTSELKGEITVTSTGLLLLGLAPNVMDQQSSTIPVMTTQIPLPYITSPWRINSEDDTEEDESLTGNPWQRNSMLILESLFLIVEDASPWIGASSFGTQDFMNIQPTGDGAGQATNIDSLDVEEILNDPLNYSDSVLRLYDEGRSALMCTEIFTLLLTHQQTCDAMLHLLFVRLPHRHEVLTRMLETRWLTQPALLRSVNKLILSSWAQLISSECHLCALFSLSYNRGKLPPWIHQMSSCPELTQVRLQTLLNQFQQVREAVLALLQSHSSSTSSIFPNLACFESTSFLLSCSLSHLAAAQCVSVLPPSLQFSSRSSAAFSVLINSARFDLSIFHRRQSPSSSVQLFYAPMVESHQGLLLEKFRALSMSDEPVGLSELIYDFNIRSLSIFAAQRVASRLSDLFASFLELITIELNNSIGADFVMPKSDSPISLTKVLDFLIPSITISLDALQHSTLIQSGRSRFCLVSITNSLVNSLVSLLDASHQAERRPVEAIPLSRAKLRSLILQLINLCVLPSSKLRSDNQSHEDPDGELSVLMMPKTSANKEQIRIELPLRLSLYASIARFIITSSRLSGTSREQPLREIYESQPDLIDGLVLQILYDLLEVENVDVNLNKSTTHNAFLPHNRLLLNCQDDLSLKRLFPSLPTTPSLTAAPLLKLIVDSAASFYRRVAILGFPRGADEDRAAQKQPGSTWLTRSGVFDTLGVWISRVLKTEIFCSATSDLLLSPFWMSSSGFPTTEVLVQPLSWGAAEMIQLIYSVISQLAVHASFCEEIFSPLTPLPVMVSSFQRFTCVDHACCRGLLLYPPFLPIHNAAIPSIEFGFPAVVDELSSDETAMLATSSINGVAKQGRRQRRDSSDYWDRWSRNVPKSTATARILPFYMYAVKTVLSHLERLDIHLMSQSSPADGVGAVESRVPASLVFLRSFLSRDRQLTSAFQCLISVYVTLQTNFPTSVDVGSHSEGGARRQAQSRSQNTASAMADLTGELNTLRLRSEMKEGTRDRHQVYWSDEDDVLDDSRMLDDNSTVIKETLLQQQRQQQQLTVSLITGKLNDLFTTVLLTAHVWCSLLKLLLARFRTTDQSASSSATTLSAEPAVLSVDETLLIFGIQGRVGQLAVTLSQMATANVLYRCAYKTGNLRWAENVKILLQEQHLAPDVLEEVSPSPAVVQRFGTDALRCIGYEFDLYEEQLRRHQQHVQGEQQTVEQFKRSLLERTRSIMLILNASLLGLLQTTPLDEKLENLNCEIEGFTGIPRAPQSLSTNLRNASAGEKPILKGNVAAVACCLRLLGISFSLLTRGIEMILNIEGIDVRRQKIVTSSSDLIAHQHSALISHTLASIHPLIVSGTTMRALKLCAKLCGSITEKPGLIAMMVDSNKIAQQALPHLHRDSPFINASTLTKAFKMVCVETLRFCSFLSDNVES